MNRLGIASIAALALATTALLGAPAAGAAAKTESTPALRIASFDARGTGGWVLGVSAGRVSKGPTGVAMTTHGPHHGEVSYIGVKGRLTADDRIVERWPGLGHIAVRFEETSKTVLSTHALKGCKVEGQAAILKGVFRGTIEFHGERGYTTVARRSARGEIVAIPREVCKRDKHPSPPHEPATQPGIEFVLAGRDLAGGSLEFSAFRLDRSFGGAAPTAEFEATYTRERHGLLTVARTEVSDEGADALTLTAPHGKPTEATVNPPAPFSGAGAFKLESPTKASWTGDLSVEIPILGDVSLTEPSFKAGACAAHCTKTFPNGAEFGFLTHSLLH